MALSVRFGGRRGVRNVPVYPIINWRNVRSDADGLLYKPGLRTLGVRLLWTFVMGFIISAIGYSFFRPDPTVERATTKAEKSQRLEEVRKRTAALETQLEGMLSEEQLRELEEKRNQRQAKSKVSRSRLNRYNKITRTSLITVMLMLAFIGIIMPLSCLWSFLVLRLNSRGDLEVRHWGILRLTTRSWPRETLERIDVTLQEIYHRGGRNQGPRHEGWRWRVSLVGQYAAHTHATDALCEFWIDQEKDFPFEARLSERTRHLLATLHELTGLNHGEPMVMKYDTRTRRTVGLRTRVVPISEPTLQRETYRSIEDVPEELRAQFAALEKQSQEQGGISAESVRQKITIRDNAGNDHTYNSVEDMPPKIRAYYERMQKRQRR